MKLNSRTFLNWSVGLILMMVAILGFREFRRNSANTYQNSPEFSSFLNQLSQIVSATNQITMRLNDGFVEITVQASKQDEFEALNKLALRAPPTAIRLAIIKDGVEHRYPQR